MSGHVRGAGTPYAVAAKADALVTGDKDLLALVDAFTVPILTPVAFGERFNHNAQNKAEGHFTQGG